MSTQNMVYNSQKEELKISEYGRNVQSLINFSKEIKDDKERQEFVEVLVDLMHQMNPIHKNNLEYKEKLWRHLFRIADYDINVTPPSGVIPTPESRNLSPAQLEYPSNQKKYRHYGHNVKQLIEKAIEMEDPEKKEEFVMVIASYMKLAYRTWNKEHYINDEVIKGDIKSMSEGKLSLPENVVIEVTVAPPKKRYKSNQNNGRGHSRHHKKSNRKRR